MSLKINVGIVTPFLKESKDFYTANFGLTVKFETDWFVLLETQQASEIAFMLPGIESFHPLFRNKYADAGLWLTFNVSNIENEYRRIKALQTIDIIQDIKTENWGERHFVIKDPNNIAIDIVQFIGTTQ